jgi:hypothetical protein
MKKILLGLSGIAIMTILSMSTNNVHAEEIPISPIVNELKEFEDISEDVVITTELTEVNNLLSNDSVHEVIYIEPDLLKDDFFEKDSFSKELAPRAIINKYRVRGVKNTTDKTDSSAIAAASGGPEVTLNISQTKNISTTTSAKFGASDKIISAEVGWSTTASHSINISGSFKVPKTSGGKKVKSCKFSAHTLRKRKSFIVDKMAWNSTKWVKQGTGYVSKPYGVSFKKTFTYK